MQQEYQKLFNQVHQQIYDNTGSYASDAYVHLWIKEHQLFEGHLELSPEERTFISYRGWVRSLTSERIHEEIEELKKEAQGNAELAESAHYHRDEPANQFLADYKDYENEYTKCQTYIMICYNVLKEKQK